MSYIDEISEVWDLVFQNIVAQKTRSFADLWFKDLKIYSYTDNTITFSTDSKFKYDTIKKTHIDILRSEFSNFLPCEIEVIFVGEEPDENALAKRISNTEIQGSSISCSRNTEWNTKWL